MLRYSTRILYISHVGADAFDNWTYIVYYSSDFGGIETNTTSPTISLTGLVPSTDYIVEIIAIGIGNRAHRIPEQLVFRTKADGK